MRGRLISVQRNETSCMHIPNLHVPGFAAMARRLLGGMLLPALLLASRVGAAPIPPAEKLLPEDTLALITTPDFTRMRELYRGSWPRQFWHDPAMRAFRDKFLTKWESEFVQPIERELGVRFKDYLDLPQGQITLALVQNGWPDESGRKLATLMLMDSGDQAGQLRTNLAELRRKWLEAGKPAKSEIIHGLEFTVIPLSTNEVPTPLRTLLPPSSEVQELGSEEPAPRDETPPTLYLGQAGSLLLLGTDPRPLEKVLVALGGGGIPTLGGLAIYQQSHNPLFREAPLYAWLNAQTLINGWTRIAAEKKENPEAPNPFDVFDWGKALKATGFTGLKTVASTFQSNAEGSLTRIHLGAPESSRQGLLKILAGQPRDAGPPPFVPADAIKFERWRLNGQQTWTTIEAMLTDLSPQALSAFNFILGTAESAARQNDPAFDIRKSLIGNLGDDLIHYEKRLRGSDAAPETSGLYLLGSPNPEVLAVVMSSLVGFFGNQTGAPDVREFLGRKIYSIPLPAMPLAECGDGKPVARPKLLYAPTASYLAFSTEAALLEEFLRGSETPPRPLRDVPGLADALRKVTLSGNSMQSYENQADTTRALFDLLRAETAESKPAEAFSGAAGKLIPEGLTAAQDGWKGWMDFSLLPPFDKVARYFSFRVVGLNAGAEGLDLLIFSPTPPALQRAAAEKQN